MFREIILHVGPHKTGSSAIQRACNANRGILQAHSVYYPHGDWHAQLGSCFCERPEEYIFNVLSNKRDRGYIKKDDASYLERFSEELSISRSEKLLLSYEGFIDLPVDALWKMKSYLKSVGDVITVIFYCREPLSFACSEISQRFKGGIAQAFDVEANAPILEYKSFSENLRNVFGDENIRPRVYSNEVMPKGDVVWDFLGALGINDDSLLKLKIADFRENPALSHEAMLLAEAIGTVGNFSSPGNGFYNQYGSILEKIEGRKFRLTSEQARQVVVAAQPHLDYLQNVYGITLEPNAGCIDDSPKLFSKTTLKSLAEAIKGLRSDKYDSAEERVVTTPSLMTNGAKLREGHDIERGQLMTFDVDFFLPQKISALEMGIHIFDENRRWAFGINSSILGQSYENVAPGSHRASYHLIADLPPGKYTAGFAFAECFLDGKNELGWYDALCEFQVYPQAEQRYVGYAHLPAAISLRPTELASEKYVITAAKGAMRPLMPLSPMTCGARSVVLVEIQNRSEQAWVGDVFRPVSLSYHWLAANGEMQIFDGIRTALPKGGVPVGATMRGEMLVVAPETPANYRLILTLVQDGIGWFEDSGFEPATVSVSVA